MKYGPFDIGFRKFARLLPALSALLLCASVASAAPVCVDGNTLAQYIGAGSCYVLAGPGIEVLFTFTPSAFSYLTDSASDPDSLGVTAADFQVFGVTGPGTQAGLRFQSSVFNVAADASFADVGLTFGVSVQANPIGFSYLFNSAHLGMTGTPGVDVDASVAAGEGEAQFNLGITNPPLPGDLSDITYPVQTSLSPAIDLFEFGPGSQITSWVESYDLVDAPEPGTWALIPGGLILLGLFRKKRFAKSILPVLALVTLFAAKSHANPLCTNLTAINGSTPAPGTTSLTIDKYIAYTTNFGGCMENDMLFKFISFGTSGTGQVIPTAANTKLIFTLTNLANDTNQVNLDYRPVAATTTGQNLTITFQYSVTAPSYKITKMDGSTAATGTPLPTRTTTIVPSTSPAATGSPFSGLAPSITFNNALSTTFTVTDSFNLSGLNKHISIATDRFTEVVPEPVTSLLMGSSLLGIGLLSRKRKV